MKNIIYLIVVTIIFSINQISFSQDNIDEVAKEAQQTLAQMVEEKLLNEDLNSKMIQNSRLSHNIEEKLVDFDRFISSDQDVSKISKSEHRFHYALQRERDLVSMVTVGGKELRPIEYNNQFLMQELNRLPAEIKANRYKGLKLYRIPNLNAYVFEDESGNAYTSYNGRSLKEGVPAKALYEELKYDAKEFQRKYGDLIKKQKLVD